MLPFIRAPLEAECAITMVLYKLAHGVPKKYNVEASTIGKYTIVIASSLAKANQLYGQVVAIHDIGGESPSCLSNCSLLQLLGLSNNLIVSSIPIEFGLLCNLEIPSL